MESPAFPKLTLWAGFDELLNVSILSFPEVTVGHSLVRGFSAKMSSIIVHCLQHSKFLRIIVDNPPARSVCCWFSKEMATADKEVCGIPLEASKFIVV
jgi:hypothetical protein